MERIIQYSIQPNDEGMNITQFLRQRLYSKQTIADLRWTTGAVCLNGEPAKMHTVLQLGDQLIIRDFEKKQSNQIRPVNLPFPVVYEDEDIVVVNKPAGMPVQPSWYYKECSLANAAAFYYKDAPGGFVYRCITRLDMDTTGLVLLAKNPISSGILYELMQLRKIKRTYYAIAEQLPAHIYKAEQKVNTEQKSEELHAGSIGTINLPIAKDETEANRYLVSMEAGRPAVTHYEILGEKDHLRYVRLQLDTGRTHQIRVHMSAIGYPLIGDGTYHPNYVMQNKNIECDGEDMERQNEEEDRTEYNIHRQALHAGQLEFPHPITGEHIFLTAPLPQDMQEKNRTIIT